MPFRDFMGHRRLLGLLSRAVARDTLPPSLVFSGPDGVGKQSIAVALAQAVNCSEPVSAVRLEQDACGECSSCVRIVRKTHADVLTLVPGQTGTIKIDQVREIIERTAYKPFEGRRRVVIIDNADLLVPAAQNALLKTLEEPPPTSIMILVSSRPDVLLPTVRSRCQCLRFGRLSSPEIVSVLQRDTGCSETEATAVAVMADGRLSRALQEQAGEFAEARQVATHVLQNLANDSGPKHKFDTARALVSQGGNRTVDRNDLNRRLQALVSLLRDVQLLSTRADKSQLVNTDLSQDLEDLTRVFNGDRISRAFLSTVQALRALERNASTKLVADWIVFKI